MSEKPPIAFGSEIIAKPSAWYRGKFILMSLVLIGYMGGFFLYDGYVGWPKHNAKFDELSAKVETATGEEKTKLIEEQKALGNKHNEFDLKLQKIIGFTGIPLGLFLLLRTLKLSRGQYRLDGETLYIPGHPPVTFDMVREIDKENWDKKGIADVSYSDPSGKIGKFRLDDYIYDRDATDTILDRIEAAISPATE